jgi:hypothetical protein
VHGQWWTRRAIGLHVTLAIVEPGFFAAAWWQLHRALGGNGLSWAYTVEWPLFGIYAVFLWWRLLHEPAEDSAALSASRTPLLRRHRRSPAEEAAEKARADAELASYNAYLQSLRADDEQHHR